MDWVRTVTDVEIAHMKLIYAAVYMSVGIMAYDPSIDVTPKSRGDTSSILSEMSTAAAEDVVLPHVYREPDYLRIPFNQRFQPLDKLVSIGRKELKGLDPKKVLAKFRWLCHDNSDKLILRYMRQLWESKKIVEAICETIKWHLTECNVEELMRRGEAYYIFDEPNDRYVKQLQSGKRTLVGHDRMGRPVNLLTARKHRAKDQSARELENFSLSMFELTFLTMQDHTDGCIIIYDMQGFTRKSMDYRISKFIIDKLNRLYPMMMVKLYVYKAPKLFKAAYKIMQPWFDQRVMQKVEFIDTPDDLLAMIPVAQLPPQLGGHSKHRYQWTPPRREDDAPLQDIATRNDLLQQRVKIMSRIELLTQEWISQTSPVRIAGIEQERRFLLEQCAANFWQLDPYVRSRTIFDRNGIFGTLRPELAKGGVAQPVCVPVATKRDILSADETSVFSHSDESGEQNTLTPSLSEYSLENLRPSNSSKFTLDRPHHFNDITVGR